MDKNNKNVNTENQSEEIKEQADRISDSSADNAAAEKISADTAENSSAEKAPAKENPSAKKSKAGAFSGKSKRIKHGALSVAFTVIFVAAIVLLNVIFNMLLDRFDVAADLSDKSVYSIDPGTADYIAGVDDDITIVVADKENNFLNAAANDSSSTIQYGQQVSQILKAFAAANPRITVEYKSLDDNPTFYSKYGATLSAKSIIIESKNTERNRIITTNDYLSPKYYFDGNEISSTEYSYYYQMGLAGSGRLSMELFAAAESSLLTSIMIVTNEDPVRVAYVDGDYSCSEPKALDTLLESNAYTIEPVKLTNAEKIDPDIDFLIIYAPIYDFSNDDINKIDVWLDNGGKYGKNMFFAAAATIDTKDLPNLTSYLKDWGLSLESGYVYQTNTDYGYEMSPTYQRLEIQESDYSTGIDTVTKNTMGDGLKPITLLFEEQSNYKTASLVSSYTGAVIAPFDMEDFDPSKAEKSGAFTVVAESNKTRFEGVDPFVSRIYAASSHFLLDQSFLQGSGVNNADLFLNIFNTASGKEEVEITVKPQSFTQETFEITGTQAKTITVIFAVIVPFAVIAAGVVIIVRRKRR